MTNIHILPAFSDNYMYLIEHEGAVAAVDPAEPGSVVDLLDKNDLKLAMVINTHHHHDHVSGNLDLKNRFGCEVVGPDDGRIPGLDRPVKEGDVVDFAQGLQVLETPGHGRSDLSFYLPPGESKGAVFTGDTLFVGGCGRLFECGPDVMWASLSRLAELPDETEVYCGHEYTLSNYRFARSLDPGHELFKTRFDEVKALRDRNQPTIPSTIGQEKASNPFLQADKAGMKQALNMDGADPADVFGELRHRKDIF
ncbi:MAG: hydroxyacylglutathione hydrolase [Verrucomicrobiota bacterium]